MDIFGIGPRIAASGIISFAVVILIDLDRHHAGYWFIPETARLAAGSALVMAGLYFWLDSVRLISTRFKRGALITEGVYRIVRNPMYAAFIDFIAPGASLILNEPLIILSALVMLLVFKTGIHREEEYLRETFGSAYLDYTAKVRQIIPFLW